MGEARIVHDGELRAAQACRFSLTRQQFFVERLHSLFRGNVVNAPERRDHCGRAGFRKRARETAVNRARIESPQVGLARGKRDDARAVKRELVVILDDVFHRQTTRVASQQQITLFWLETVDETVRGKVYG